LIAWNESHPDAIPYGQNLLAAAQATSGLDNPAYRQDRHRDIVLSRVAGIHAALGLGVDLLIAPMSTLAKCTGKAGSPVLAIPLGLDDADAPIGVTLLGAFGGDADLLRAGAAIAQLVGDRRLPVLHSK
jgi:amidase